MKHILLKFYCDDFTDDFTVDFTVTAAGTVTQRKLNI